LCHNPSAAKPYDKAIAEQDVQQRNHCYPGNALVGNLLVSVSH
jgi:hypothetical protein